MQLKEEEIDILKFIDKNSNKKIKCSLDIISYSLNINPDKIIKLIKQKYITNDIKNNKFVDDYYLTDKAKNIIKSKK